MPSPNLQKFNTLLSAIRNPANSLGKREAALRELENQVNEYAEQEDKRFHATLANFDKQWAAFENTLDAMDNAFASFLDNDIDDAEVNAIMQQIQDEVQFDKKFSRKTPSKVLSAKFNPDAPSPITENFIKELKELAAEAENKQLSLEEEFQLALDGLTKTIVYPKSSAPLSPPQSSYKTPLNPIQETKISNHQLDLNLQSIPSTYPNKKTNLFESFIKHVVDFVKSVGEFFQKNNSTSSIKKISAQLKNVDEELKSTKKQLDRTEAKLQKSIQSQQERKELGREVGQLSERHERSTNKIAETQAQLKKAKQAYRIADITLLTVMKKVNNFLDSKQEKPYQTTQSRIKESVQKGRHNYQQSHEKPILEINPSEMKAPKYP